jgi:hypothetical protein
MCIKIFSRLFIINNLFTISGRGVMIFILFIASFTMQAQRHLLVANNDTVRTSPFQKVKKDVIVNDIIPDDNYSWQIISVLDSITQGVASSEGDFLVFTPGASCRNTSFDIQYKLMGSGIDSTATVHIEVSNYNNPVNVLSPDVKCIVDMPSGVTFKVHEKLKNTSIVLDGFSMPLVGDISGDGKPDIIALGLGRTGNYTDGNGLAARAWYVHVFDGQTGQRTWSVNLGTEPTSGALPNVTSLNHQGITSDVNESLDQFQLRFDPRHNSPGHLAIADLDNDGLGEIVVVECGNLGKIYALKPSVDSTRKITGFSVLWYGNNNGNSYSYKFPVIGNHETYGSGVPYIADINGDGQAEVIVYNKIFNGKTGQIICQLETLNNFGFPTSSNYTTIQRDYAYVGRRPGASWQDSYIPCMVIVDINNDGILDIVAGSKVYLMKDQNGNPALDKIIYGPASITAQRGNSESATLTTYVTDGFTSVADIDLDGHLEVIVLAPTTGGLNDQTENILYVWDPLQNPTSPKAALYLYTKSSSGTMSYPFVGDINGKIDNYDKNKRLPEICFNGGRFYTSENRSSKIVFHPLSNIDLTVGGITGASSSRGFNQDPGSGIMGHIVAFTYHANPDGSTPLHQRLKLSWAMEHGDESSCTGITMFDFDNDDIKELCYRDEISVRVISPALKTYITNSDTASVTGAIRFKQNNVRSYTGFEAPVIADVDLDGSADIITLAYPGSESAGRSKGHIYVFEHSSGYDKWAPCPPVWNQTIYFPLQINENLTVPAKPQFMLTPYTDKNGDTIYPYNGQWIQQPVVKEGSDYLPVVRNPDMTINNMTIKVQSNLKSTVTLTISNQGSASVNAQTPIAFYDGGIAGITIANGASFIQKVAVGVDIFPGEKVTRSYEIYGDFNNKLVWARLVDDSVNFPATGYEECALMNNVFSAIDCPNLIYHITTSTNGDLLCDTNHIILTALPVNLADSPTYQWYRNDKLLIGDTLQTYITATAGDYKCYITDGICRGFSSTKTISRAVIIPHDDYVSLMTGSSVKINVLGNDQIPTECKITPSITTFPVNGTAFVVNDSILYQPNTGFAGIDSFQYNLNGLATVYIIVYPFPDNINAARCFSKPPSLTWSINSGKTVGSKSSLYQNVLVGDLDGDGFSEIIAPKERVSSDWLAGYYTDAVNIYDMKTSTMKTINTAAFATSDLGLVGIAKSHASDSAALIVISSKDGYLYAYNKAGVQQWKSNAKYTDVAPPYKYTYLAGAISFADFNGDGYAEIYIRDKIFDLKTGTMLLKLNDEVRTMCELGSTVADLNKDGILELIIRGKVYQVTITNRTGTSGNTASIWKEVINNPHPNSGKTTIAVDFDLDGYLDILVNDSGWFYIWDPYTGNVKIDQNKGSNYSGMGCPVVGDIDNDGYPEIVYTGITHVTAWDIDGKKTASAKWKISTNDQSGYTGITLFDFNQDGYEELVYRDETQLRIINGNDANTVKTSLATIACTSGTQGEYAVIADVDRDEQAELIITGGSAGESVPSSGPIRIFKAGAGNKWAPTRKVWNQYAYNMVNVNEDLSIPKMPISQSMVFPGNDTVLGTADDVRPYNGFLQQQTILNKNGNKLWLLPNIKMANNPTFYYHANGDSLQIFIFVTNIGDALMNMPFYVSAYANTVTTTNKMTTQTYTTIVPIGDTVKISFTIAKLSSYQSLNNILVRLNDKGDAKYDQLECNYTDNEISYHRSAILMAHHDYGITVADPVNIKVLANDSIPVNCKSSIRFDTIAGGSPKNGVLVINSDSSFTYKPNAKFFGTDSIGYYIKCNSDSSIARVYIIKNKPLSQKYIACDGASLVIGFEALTGVQYYWFAAENDTIHHHIANTITIAKDENNLQSWWAEPRYNGMIFPRFRIDMELSDNCGRTNPVGCIRTGTLLFREDFGGNSPSDPSTKRTGIPQVEKYTYNQTLNGHGVYAISKTSKNFVQNLWFKNISDHTFPNDTSRGYMIAFDASNSPGQFYKHQIDNLCAGTRLYFSAWITSLLSNNSRKDKANLIFLLEDTMTNTLAKYYVGNIPDADANWKNYGFGFTVPQGQSSIVLKIINNGTGADGNDFVMDDIEIRLCTPVVNVNTPSKDTSICFGSSVALHGYYRDDGTYGNDLEYHWEFNVNGHLEEDTNWTTIPNSGGTSSNGVVSSVFTIAKVTESQAGYYRLATGNKETILSPTCRAASRLVKISIDTLPVLDIVKDTLLCTMDNLVNLIRHVPDKSIVRFYRDSLATTPLVLPVVHILSDTVFYGRAIDTVTGCEGKIESIRIRQGVYPPDIPITGTNIVCIGDTITLKNASTENGSWRVSNPSILKMINPTSDSVKIVGLKADVAFVSYTTGVSSCLTRVTFKVKVIEKKTHRVIIGIERE